MLFSQCAHSFVPTETVGLCVILVGQLCHFPFVEQLGEHVLWFPSHHKKPVGVQHNNLKKKTCTQTNNSSRYRQDFRCCPVPGIQFPEAGVQVFERPDEEPPAFDAVTGLIVEVRVQYEHRVELLAVLECSHQGRVVVQPEALAEPVNACMRHPWEPVNTQSQKVPSDFVPQWVAGRSVLQTLHANFG